MEDFEPGGGGWLQTVGPNEHKGLPCRLLSGCIELKLLSVKGIIFAEEIAQMK